MKTVQKAALSLLITVVVFSGFSILAFSGLFSVIETRFYNQRVTNSFMEELSRTSGSIDEYHTEYINRFEAVLQQDFIKRAYLPNLSAEDINERANLFQYLQEELSGFLFTRFIDTNGNIHFSTLGSDIKDSTDFSITYSRLEDILSAEAIDRLLLTEGEERKIVLDGQNNHIIFVFPFYDTLSIFKGTALFYVSGRDFASHLLREGILLTGQDVEIVDDKGFLLHSGLNIDANVMDQINRSWEREAKIVDKKTLLESDSGNTFALLSKESEMYFYTVGRLLSDDIFTLNNYLKIILMASFFVTLFLLLFLILSLRQDKVVVLGERIKRFQVNFLKEYVENKESIDWEKWKRELGARRELVKKEIKRGIGSFKGANEETVDGLIEKSWDEIIEVIGSKVNKGTAPVQLTDKINIENLEEALERVLKSGAALNVQYKASETSSASIPAPTLKPQPARERGDESFTAGMKPIEVEDVEDVEEIEAMDEVEDIEEMAAADELEEAEEAEPVEEVQAVEEDIEEMAAADELEESEEIEEAEPVEEVEAVEEDIEEMAAADGLEEAEEIEEIEPAEEPDDLDAASASITSEAGQLEEIDDESEAGDMEEFRETEEEYEEVSPEEEGVPEEVETVDLPEEPDDVEELEEFEEGAEDTPEVEEVPEEEPEEVEEVEEIEEREEMKGSEQQEEELPLLEEPEEIQLSPLHIVRSEIGEDEQIEELSEVEETSEESEVLLDKVSGGYSFTRMFQSGFSHEFSSGKQEIIRGNLDEPDELEEIFDSKGTIQHTGNSGLDKLIDTNVITIVSAAEVLGWLPQAAGPVIEEKNGIFTVSEEVLSGNAGSETDSEFKKLTEEVLSDKKEQKKGTSAIEDLFSFSDVDLSLDISPAAEEEVSEEVGLQDEKPSQGNGLHSAFTDEGIDIDTLFTVFSKAGITPIKGFMRLSKIVEAVYIGILFYDNGAYKPDLTIGLDNESIEKFQYYVNEEIIRYVIDQKSYLYGKYRDIELPAFKPKLSENDKRHLFNYLFIPGKYRKSDGILFLGFKSEIKSIRDFIERLFSSDFLSV